MDNIPVLILTILAGLLCAVLGAAGPLLLRRYFPFEDLHRNNEVAGVKFGALAAFYSVLLAFVVVVVWSGYTDADATCHQEAANCQTLYRLSRGLKLSDEAHLKIEDAIRRYVEMVIKDEWKAMAQGKPSPETNQQFRDLSDMIMLVYNEPFMKDNNGALNPGALNVHAEMLAVYSRLSVDRNQRLLSGATDVPVILWAVLVMGAIAALIFGCFFGSPNVYAQATMNALVAMLLGLILLAIFLLDRNFAGELGITPHAFERVLQVMEPYKP